MPRMRTVTIQQEPGLEERVVALRVAAWGPVIGIEAARARFGWDAADESAYHVVIETEGSYVAAGRVAVVTASDPLPDESSYDPHRAHMRFPVAVTSRLVVHPDHRGRGHAGAVIDARVALARRLGVNQAWAETRLERAEGFVARGFREVGASGDRSVPGRWGIFCLELTPG